MKKLIFATLFITAGFVVVTAQTTEAKKTMSAKTETMKVAPKAEKLTKKENATTEKSEIIANDKKVQAKLAKENMNHSAVLQDNKAVKTEEPKKKMPKVE
ncbi:hypothetical protein [Soonwooa purpurea]